METTSVSFPLNWHAGACVFYIGGISRPLFPPPKGSTSMMPFTVPQHSPGGSTGEGKERELGGRRPAFVLPT